MQPGSLIELIRELNKVEREFVIQNKARVVPIMGEVYECASIEPPPEGTNWEARLVVHECGPTVGFDIQIWRELLPPDPLLEEKLQPEEIYV